MKLSLYKKEIRSGSTIIDTKEMGSLVFLSFQKRNEKFCLLSEYSSHPI